MKYCINCRHLKGPEYTNQPIENFKCDKTSIESPVSGARMTMSADTQRQMTGDEFCGPDARFFEDKSRDMRGENEGTE